MSRKLALIIGNNDYQINPLKNCVNDATSLANVLRGVDCEVELHTNLNSEAMYECINDFTKTIQANDFIIFFFAGHAVQWGDRNFLIPCDNRKITSDRDMQRFAINAQENVDEVAKMKPHVILFLLDCCRDYWLPSSARTVSIIHQVGGLNKMVAPPGTLIAFACASGQIASDRSSDGTNGIFTKYLLKYITTAGMDIEMVLRKVASGVANETSQSQIPYRVSSITTDNVCLVPLEKSNSSSLSKHRIVSASTNQSINILFIGEKNVGKATFINAFVNYLTFKTVEQAQSNRNVVLKPLSFRMTNNDTFEEHLIKFGNVDHHNQTIIQRCQTYTFDLNQSDGKKLNLIDTPSLDDTQDFDQDNANNIKHILDYVNNLTHLNAICFLVKPDASRLLNSFQSCFAQLLNRLGTNTRQNVIFCFTNALASFSMPGNTASLLRNMFASFSMNDIPFSKENAFFFDNESFRYLIAVQNGIRFNHEDKAVYEMSWSESVGESNRFLNYIRTKLTACRIVKK